MAVPNTGIQLPVCWGAGQQRPNTEPTPNEMYSQPYWRSRRTQYQSGRGEEGERSPPHQGIRPPTATQTTSVTAQGHHASLHPPAKTPRTSLLAPSSEMKRTAAGSGHCRRSIFRASGRAARPNTTALLMPKSAANWPLGGHHQTGSGHHVIMTNISQKTVSQIWRAPVATRQRCIAAATPCRRHP